MNYNTFLSLFGLNPNDFKPAASDPYEDENGNTCFYIEQRTDINRICPFCNSQNIKIKDHDEIVLNCTSNSYQKHELIIRKVRFLCRDCKKTYTPKISNVDSNSNITNTVKRLIINDFFNTISFTDIARKYDVSVGTVFNLFDDTFKNVNRGKLPKILCIDEFHFAKDIEQNYCCVIVNLETREIVDVLRNRRKEFLDEFFSAISAEERDKVEYFISDMYDEYAIAREKYFPKATHIIDRFHVVLQLTNAIKQRRTKVMKSIKDTKKMYYNFMKTNWELYERSRYKIPNKEYKNTKTGYVYSYEYLFNQTLKLDHDLSAAYECLQDLVVKSYKTPDDKLRNFFKEMAGKLKNLDYEPLKKVGDTYLKWIDGITEAYTEKAIENKLTNGLAENTNNRIKTIIKISYGLNNFPRMRKRCLLIHGENSKQRKKR